MTQQDIANSVGVSHVTVSHVLHRSRLSRVSAEMQEEIFRVAREMGYQPRDVTTHTIAVVVEPDSLWFDVTTNVLTHADEILRNHGFRMSVSTLGAANMDEAPARFDQKSVDGVIFTEWHAGMEQYISELSVPSLLIADTDQAPANIDQIAMDTTFTAGEIARYLLQRGHKYLCVVTGIAGVGMHERLKRGVFDALKEAGLPEKNLSVIHDREDEEFERKLLWLLKQKAAPTAIIGGGPGNAFVTLNRLQCNGYHVPEEISLVSLIDSPRLTALKPKVTATNALGYQHIEAAIQRLLKRIKRPALKAERTLLPGGVIERDSVALAYQPPRK